MRKTIVAAIATMATACSLFGPEKNPSPSFDQLDIADACKVACDTLRMVGCPEGNGALGGEPCAVICVRTSQLRPLPLGCWSVAGDAVAARSCGSLRCVK